MSKVISLQTKLVSLLVMGFLISSSLALVPTSASSNTTGFKVINVEWGTPTNSTSAAPGDRNVPLTVTLQYVFPNTATNVQGLLELPHGMSLYNGSSLDFASISQITPTGTIFELTFDSIYLASNLPLGSYSATLNLSWTASGYAYVLNQTSTVTLYVSGRSQISFSSPSHSLIPGEVNNVSLSIYNNGTGSASNITISVASQNVGVLNSVPEIQSLTAGSSSVYTLQLYVPKTAAGSVISLELSAGYKDPYGNSRSASQALEFYSSNLNEPSLSFTVASHTLTPGQVNNVTVAITNAGSGAAYNIVTTVSGSQGVNSVSDFPKIASLSSGSSYSTTIQIYVASSASGSSAALTFSANYADSYGVPGTSSQSEGFQIAPSSLHEPSLEFSVTPHTLVPGQVNNVTVTVTNTGSGSASNIVIAINSQGLTSVSDFPRISLLGEGASYSTVLELYVANSAAGSPATLTFSSSYVDSYGVSGSTSQSEGFQIASSVAANTSLSVTTLSNSVTTGSVSKVSFLVKNIGDSTIYSPTFTVSISQPLVVAENSTFSSGTSIASGQSEIFTTYLTASPGSTSGVYSATLQVSFTDKYGTSHDQSYSAAVMLSGAVELVIQNEAVSQNATGITVTGSILDEGSASAYYAVVSAYLNGSKVTGSPDYVGEIDANSPVPFTATIPFRAGESSQAGNITIFIQYRNSLGRTLNSSSSETTQLKAISQILSSNSTTTPNTSNQNGILGLSRIQLIIVFTVVLVVAGTGTVAVIRRRQGRRQVRATKDSDSVS